MLRRHLLGLAAAAFAARRQSERKNAGSDTFVAEATEDTTPRVAIVLSNFKKSTDHDGTELKGLSKPSAPGAPPGAGQLDEMVRKAIELGNTRHGDLASILEDADWVVIKPQIGVQRTADGRLAAGAVADPRIVKAVIGWLSGQPEVKRITIAEGPSGSGSDFDPWASEWDGAFGSLSYRKLVDEAARAYPRLRFDVADLNRDETMEMQVPSRVGAPGSGSYKVASTLIRSQKLITVAPLATSARTGVSLSIGSYLGALPAQVYGPLKEKAAALGPPSEVLVDLFSFRPPDYAILGGEWALEGGDSQGSNAVSVRHNLVLAGANAVAVDAVAAAVMGFDPSKIAHLELASRKGLGSIDLDTIWTRGNEIDEAKRPFRPAASR